MRGSNSSACCPESMHHGITVLCACSQQLCLWLSNSTAAVVSPCTVTDELLSNYRIVKRVINFLQTRQLQQRGLQACCC